MTLRGNAVVAQSGGPTTVINSSACGVIQHALQSKSNITGILGASNGILGILHEDLFDLAAESPDTIAALRQTPSSAIGSCRHRLGDLDKQKDQFERLLHVFAAHDIRYFFYIGGNDSMDTANKVHMLAKQSGYDLRVVGVPKTIDNDLLMTDHCPGFGSVAKFLATCVMEAGRDTEAMYTIDPITVTEAMGRNTGWIAAATGIAQTNPDEAPHLIYVPEHTFDTDQFLADIDNVYSRLGRAFVVVSEGVKDADGEYIAAQDEVDPFGHRQLGGASDNLRKLISKRLNLKARHNKLDTIQRNAMHWASLTDSNEAYACGQEAVRKAIDGQSGIMIGLVRCGDQPYQCETRAFELGEVANGVKTLPDEYMNTARNHVSDGLRRYVTPLVQGQVEIRIGPNGLPQFAQFRRVFVPKRLPVFEL